VAEKQGQFANRALCFGSVLRGRFMRKFSYITVDVFTAKKLQGNQLAVFTDARGLLDDEMQALAREMNLSETTFVIPRAAEVEAERGLKTRIFTVQSELPFAGHPTLGTAFVLRGGSGASEIALDLTLGKIPVSFSEREGLIFGEMTQRDPEFGMVHRRDEIASVCSIDVDEIDPDLPIETVSTGNPFVIVPIRSLEAIGNLAVQWRTIAEYLTNSDASFFYFVTCQTQDPAAKLHARMIFFGGEDPATGSAAGPAAAWMVKHKLALPDEQAIIEQGLEARRPSRIFVRAGAVDGRVCNVRVGGHVVEVAHGEVTL
jgi:trans-2,3-dihydro-3-hydroxyanthranilate isomerase